MKFVLSKLLRVFIRYLDGVKRRINKFYYGVMLESLGVGCQIDSNVRMYGSNNITIGSNCIINRDVIIQSCDGAKINISNDVTLSYGVKIITGALDYKNITTDRKHVSQDVSISKNVWIGANAVILPGINIGECVVVAAGSVVTRNVDAYSLVGGVPAKVIKLINEL